MSGQGDVDDHKQQIGRPWKVLEPRPLRIGRMDRVIEGCSRILGPVRCAGGTVRTARMGTEYDSRKKASHVVYAPRSSGDF